MSRKQIKTLLLILILFVIIIDILIRLFYARTIHLSFNTQNFNNIATPIISFFGFIAIVYTIHLTIKQLKQNQSINYFKYYKEYIDKIADETPQNNNHLSFSTLDLLKFNDFVIDKYDELQINSDYKDDLRRFKEGKYVKDDGKSYNFILGKLRLFRASLSILLKRYYMLINEIELHKILENNDKEILFKYFYESQLWQYTSGCWVVDFEDELKIIKENLYIGFIPKMKDELKFYNSDFYELLELVEKNKVLNSLKNETYK